MNLINFLKEYIKMPAGFAGVMAPIYIHEEIGAIPETLNEILDTTGFVSTIFVGGILGGLTADYLLKKGIFEKPEESINNAYT